MVGAGSKGEKSSELGCYRPSEVVGDAGACLSQPPQPSHRRSNEDRTNGGRRHGSSAAISRVDMAASYWRNVLGLDGKGLIG